MDYDEEMKIVEKYNKWQNYMYESYPEHIIAYTKDGDWYKVITAGKTEDEFQDNIAMKLQTGELSSKTPIYFYSTRPSHWSHGLSFDNVYKGDENG